MLVIPDVHTQWLQAYPVPAKDHERVVECLLSFFGPQYHPDYSGPGGKKVPSKVYSDGAKEYKLALTDLHWIAETCTPHRKQTNGVAERAVRRVREGTAAALLQAGMDPIWWPEASQCFCFLRVARDPLHPDGKTAYERRWKLKFDGPLIPFGAEVSFLPSTPDDRAAVHPMGSKTLTGVFVGYHQEVGGAWSGDLFVVPLRNIGGNNQSKPHCRRIAAGDVFVEKKKGR